MSSPHFTRTQPGSRVSKPAGSEEEDTRTTAQPWTQAMVSDGAHRACPTLWEDVVGAGAVGKRSRESSCTSGLQAESIIVMSMALFSLRFDMGRHESHSAITGICPVFPPNLMMRISYSILHLEEAHIWDLNGFLLVL